MRYLKLILIVSVIALFTGCVPTYSWYAEQNIETPEEAKAVADLEQSLIFKAMGDLSLVGHDQNIMDGYPDMLDKAHAIAIKTCCKTRMYEYQTSWGDTPRKTGKVKDIEYLSK